jgi:hypothetical protein
VHKWRSNIFSRSNSRAENGEAIRAIRHDFGKQQLWDQKIQYLGKKSIGQEKINNLDRIS